MDDKYFDLDQRMDVTEPLNPTSGVAGLKMPSSNHSTRLDEDANVDIFQFVIVSLVNKIYYNNDTIQDLRAFTSFCHEQPVTLPYFIERKLNRNVAPPTHPLRISKSENSTPLKEMDINLPRRITRKTSPKCKA